jgi:hypothetical protein
LSGQDLFLKITVSLSFFIEMRRNATFTAEGRFNSKARRIQDLRKHIKQSPPPLESYTSNTTKEELCMEYVKTFISQFSSVYPNRKIPYMIAENEYGVKKFVCSTLRPTQLQFSELYDMYECAVFLAGYMLYEPLDPPSEPPTVLPSPCFSLDRHVGDSFDMAVILCSLLIGNGYDAYVVNGYAPKYIALHDQTRTQCPLISKLAENSVNQVVESDEGPEQPSPDNPYIPPNNEVRESTYLEQQREKKRLEGLDSFILWCSDTNELPNPDVNGDAVKRAHAWVLVRAGMMDVSEHTFLEPSTGRAYTTMSSPYLGIESIWNKSNYWVNVNVNTPPADVSHVISYYI